MNIAETLCDHALCRYFLLWYEDLVEDTMNVTRQLYKFSGLEFDDTVQRHVLELTNGAEQRTGPFEISRPKSFNHNHWRQEMDRETVENIENTPVCREFMDEMDYL